MRVNRFTSSLLTSGLKKHDRVAFLAPNTPALLEAHYAVPAARGVIVAINTRLSPDEIEYILKHSEVLECAVIAIPDEKWGERPKAFVTLKGSHSVTEEQLILFCRTNLAHFKCPDKVEFCELPKTSTGKVQKYLLRVREWKEKEKRIN